MASIGFHPTSESSDTPLDPEAQVPEDATPEAQPDSAGPADSARPTDSARSTDSARLSGDADPSDRSDLSDEAELLIARLSAAIESAEQIPTEVAVYDGVSNHTVVVLHELAANLLRLAGVALALTAGQIERRSARELGSQGMARQGGHRTPEEMAKSVGKIPHQDAARAMRQGRLIHETQTTDTAETTGAPPPVNPTTGEVVTPIEPWLAGVGRALTRGLSLESADAIRRGLGVPTEDVTIDALKIAADQLCAEASRMDPDRLFIRARRLRDELDAAGIGLREEERRQQRSLRIVKQRDGMVLLKWVMDPETYATVGEAYDRATSPRRGGPRSGNGSVGKQAARIESDPRTTEQIASDDFAQIIQIGLAADSSMVLGTGAPSVRILTTAPLPARHRALRAQQEYHRGHCGHSSTHRSGHKARSPGMSVPPALP